MQEHNGVQLPQHGDGHHQVGAVGQNQVGLANGVCQLQQVFDLSAGYQLLWGWEIWQFTSHPHSVELTQIIDVRLDAVQNFALPHVIQGWSYQVRMIGLCLPMFGEVTGHGVSAGPSRDIFSNLFVMPSVEMGVQ